MVPEKRKYGVPERRDKIITCLENAYAENNLELDEYERRLDLANKAESIEDLEALVFDFPDHQKPRTLGPAEFISDESDELKLAIIGDQHLTAEDFSGKAMKTLSIIGDVSIDIRRFRNSVDPVCIKVYSLSGDTRIIIPRGMKIKNRMKSILGDYELVRNEEKSEDSPEKRPTASSRKLGKIGRKVRPCGGIHLQVRGPSHSPCRSAG